MSKEICISSTPHETRLAILEDEQLTEVYYERENEYTLAGSIYKGRVTRVLPGMQSAFVDLGLERDAFLYVTDFMEEQEDSSDFERIPANGEETGREPGPRAGRSSQNRPTACRSRGSGRRAGSTAQRRPGRSVLPAPAVRRRGESLRMEPGVGGVAVAAARAFGHRKAGSRPLRNRLSPGPPGGLPAVEPAAPVEAGVLSQQPRPPSRSLCQASRFRSMAVKALPGRPRQPVEAGRAAASQCHPDQALDADRDADRVERRWPAPRRVHLPLSRCPLAKPQLLLTASQLLPPVCRRPSLFCRQEAVSA